jgi:hypothetical protein
MLGVVGKRVLRGKGIGTHLYAADAYSGARVRALVHDPAERIVAQTVLQASLQPVDLGQPV